MKPRHAAALALDIIFLVNRRFWMPEHEPRLTAPKADARRMSYPSWVACCVLA
jgi:hypothetical protein